MSGIVLPALSYPRSAFEDHGIPMKSISERDVLQEILLDEHYPEGFQATTGDETFTEVELHEFSIHRPHKSKGSGKRKLEAMSANELVSLDHLCDRGIDVFLVDGIISYGKKRHFVEAVPFEDLSIGGYEDTQQPMVSDVWIQSLQGKKNNTWYCLKEPASEYRRFHEPFLWLADLAKHTLDFLHAHESVPISLLDFKHNFIRWLSRLHGSKPLFQLWFEKFGRNPDFRRPIAAHVKFLISQADSLDSSYLSHQLWTEIEPTRMTAVPSQPRAETRTIVTPYGEYFSVWFLPFSCIHNCIGTCLGS